MDRQATIGFILIAIVFVIWMVLTSQQTTPPSEPTEVITDTTTLDSTSEKNVDLPKESDYPAQVEVNFGKWFSNSTSGTEEEFTVETDKYIAIFTSKGGGLKRWYLKGYSTWNNQRLQLIDWNVPGDLSMVFATSDGRLVDTKDLFFTFHDIPQSKHIVLAGSDTFSFRAVLILNQGMSSITRIYSIRNSDYAFDFEVKLNNMAEVIANHEYQLTIHSPAITERNSVDEASFSEANAFIGNEKILTDATDFNSEVKENLTGKAHWISIQNKYFLSSLIPHDGFEGTGAYLIGNKVGLPDNGEREIYQASLKMRFNGAPTESARFALFIGPIKYDLLKEQHEGLEQVMSLGWAWVVRPFSEYLILPLFSFLHSFIPNYGFVIIIFTILIKLLLHPLTKSSMESMRKMQSLQPLMTELREKYKDDQQRQNTEMMKLYKDYGINPAGGCLPMLLQMPILFALFVVFRSIIELRQQPFMLWITDLSSPDILFSLPFSMPLLGTNEISGLAFAMGVTMFIQQKQTIKDPRQKMMIYVMPVMFWLMFNGFPSGLNLYYFLFNLLSIGQQYFITRKTKNLPLEKVKPRKGGRKGWMEKVMASMEEKAKAQQRTRK